MHPPLPSLPLSNSHFEEGLECLGQGDLLQLLKLLHTSPHEGSQLVTLIDTLPPVSVVVGTLTSQTPSIPQTTHHHIPM